MEIANILMSEWSDECSHRQMEITCWADANNLIHSLIHETNTPCIVELYWTATGRSLGIGIGRESTIVTYQSSLDPPYFISEGCKHAQGTEWFCYGGEVTEYLARNLVPFHEGLLAVKQFVELGNRPDNIAWESL